jgi:MFS family permease
MVERLRARLPPLLERDATFRRFWLGQSASLVGDEVTLVALPLLGLLTLGLGAAQLSVLTAVAMVPNLLFSLHAGAWIDRRGGRRRAMATADVGRAAVLVALALAGTAGVLARGELYVGAFLAGTLSVVFNVAYSSLFVTLVGREDFVAAGQMLQGARALAAVVGPTLGGLLVQLVTAPLALLVDVGSFAISAATLRSIAPVETPPAGREAGGLTSGLRFIARSRYVGPTLVAIATVSFAGAGVRVLVLLYAVRSLGISAGGLGAILGIGSVGAVAGAASAGRLTRALGLGRAMTLGLAATTSCTLLIPLAGGPLALVAATLIVAQIGAGFGMLLFDVTAGALLASAIPAPIRSRVQGAFMFVNYGARPFGALLAGALAGALGVRAALLALPLLGLLGVLALLVSPVQRLRAVDGV